MRNTFSPQSRLWNWPKDFNCHAQFYFDNSAQVKVQTNCFKIYDTCSETSLYNKRLETVMHLRDRWATQFFLGICIFDQMVMEGCSWCGPIAVDGILVAENQRNGVCQGVHGVV